jgi:UDP-N-acetylmuramoylalanine--D-glutamate ligase
LFDFNGKTVLVVGLARSGVAAADVLIKSGAQVLANDTKDESQLVEEVKTLSAIGAKLYLNMTPEALVSQADFLVISPGVPIDSPFIEMAQKSGKEVISEIELAYRLCKAPIIAITGTNGKTTTTALTGEILRFSGFTTHVVGNIGVPFISKVHEISANHKVVAEISSFQLEAIRFFRPFASAVLNITEDHLNRHKTFENYVAAKARIFENAQKGDYVVLNADDDVASGLSRRINTNVLYFSRRKKITHGAWIEDGMITVDIGDGKIPVCHTDELLIPGEHNIENALAAVLLSALAKAPYADIARALRSFRGVEHRIELVDRIENIAFYNDSKGTNPDASIKAIKAMKGPTVLIAGGMDKGSSFDDLINAFGSTVTYLVVLGETAGKIAKTAKEAGFERVLRVKTLEEAVLTAFKAALPQGNVLLSPACASWDMFNDYEHRGRVFKDSVRKLRETDE